MKKIFLLLLLFILKNNCQAISSNFLKLNIVLENCPYEDLYLNFYTDDKGIFIKGEKLTRKEWVFKVSDTLVDKYEFMTLCVLLKKNTNNFGLIRFNILENGQTSIVVNFGIHSGNNRIHAIFKSEDNLSRSKLDLNKSESTLDDIVLDFNLLSVDDNSDILIRAEEPFFSWFMPLDAFDKSSYSDYLKKYVTLSQKYPDSPYLINNLSNNLNKYKSKKDIEAIFSNFSKQNKETKWGQSIIKFMKGKFINLTLINVEKNQKEKVVVDSTKFNLVVFSASWCVPCLEELPLLNDIKNKSNKNLNLTIVSIDSKIKGVNMLQKAFGTSHFRLLHNFTSVDEIKKCYNIESIPHSILIYPNGNYEKLELRQTDQLNLLYKIISN